MEALDEHVRPEPAEASVEVAGEPPADDSVGDCCCV
ncbi:hypothetical protein PI125_g19111 [Phytophthora idaei]|nr:hypothetical protein PI125_g19111 [Phytophthora idaei]